MKKSEIIKQHQVSQEDTGSSEVQISLLTHRIKSLTEHFKIHKKDNHSKYGLHKIISRRKKLMRYLKRTSINSYKKLIEQLKLRDVC